MNCGTFVGALGWLAHRKKMSSIIDLLTDELIVNIICTWIRDEDNIVRLDTAVCNNVSRLKYLNCVAKNAFQQFDSKVYLVDESRMFKAFSKWLGLRKFSMNHLKFELNSNNLSKFPCRYFQQLINISVKIEKTYQRDVDNKSKTVDIDWFLSHFELLESLSIHFDHHHGPGQKSF